MDKIASLKWWKEKLDKALAPRPRKPKEPSIYATFYERMMAVVIDMTLLFFMLNPTMQAMSRQIYDHITPEQAQFLAQSQNPSEFYYNTIQSGFIVLWGINFTLQIFLIAITYITCQMLFKTTPGKWIMGIKLTTADNQTFPPFWRLLLRFIAFIPSCAPLLLGVVWMNFDKQSRTWHDWIAGTRVITTRPHGWYWAQVRCGFAWLRKKLNGG